jgi:hypothetical protein
MWDSFLQEANCTTPVGEIASRVYSSISDGTDGIHSYFEEGIRKMYLIRSELNKCDLIFLQTICSALPLSPSDVIILDNKHQFVFSPPKKLNLLLFFK